MRDLAVKVSQRYVTFILSPVGKLGFFVDFGFKMHFCCWGCYVSVNWNMKRVFWWVLRVKSGISCFSRRFVRDFQIANSVDTLPTFCNKEVLLFKVFWPKKFLTVEIPRNFRWRCSAKRVFNKLGVKSQKIDSGQYIGFKINLRTFENCQAEQVSSNLYFIHCDALRISNFRWQPRVPGGQNASQNTANWKFTRWCTIILTK